jgi:replicative DNA helicase
MPVKDMKQGRRGKSPEDARALPAAGDRLPPHSIEAEQGVLGCVFLAPQDCLSVCGEAGLVAKAFYDLRHQLIWDCLASLYDQGQAVDVITAQQWLKDRGGLEQVGGLAYLASLPNAQSSAHNLAAYLDIVREKARLRRLLVLCAYTTQQVYEWAGDSDGLFEGFQKEALALTEESAGHAELHVRGLVLENINRFETEYHRGSAQITGLTTGLAYLDKVTGGLGGENGNYICVAARPGTGKTSMALDFVLHAAQRHEWYSVAEMEAVATLFEQAGEADAAALLRKIVREQRLCEGVEQLALPEGYLWAKDKSVIFQRHRGLPCAFFSLEMTAVRLVRRMLFQQSGRDLQRFRTGFAQAGDFVKLGQAGQAIARAPIWVDDTSRLTVEMFKARCRRMVRQHGIRLFCLDYVQLMKSIRERHQRPDRVAELEEISGEIRALSKELNVPIILLGQLNRDVERGDRWRPPRSSDIKNCGAIEQDADVIMLLYRPGWDIKQDGEQYEAWLEQVQRVQPEGEDWSKRLRRINVLVDKNRDGMTGDCELVFNGSSTHFMDYGVWQKDHGLKELAKGESRPARPEDGPGDDLGEVAEGFPD